MSERESNERPYSDRPVGWPAEVRRELDRAERRWSWLLWLAALAMSSFAIAAVLTWATDWSAPESVVGMLGTVALLSMMAHGFATDRAATRVVPLPELHGPGLGAAGASVSLTAASDAGQRLAAPEAEVLRNGARVGDRRLVALMLEELLLSGALEFRLDPRRDRVGTAPGPTFGSPFRPPLESVLAVHAELQDGGSASEVDLRSLLYGVFRAYRAHNGFGSDTHVLALLVVLPALEAGGYCVPVHGQPAGVGRVSAWTLTGPGEALRRELRRRPPEGERLLAEASDVGMTGNYWRAFRLIEKEVKWVWRDMYKDDS